MTIVLKVLSNNLDNDFVFYTLCIGVVGAMGYSLTSKLLRKSYKDTGVQTDTLENLSDNDSSSDTLSDCSTETLSPLSSTFESTSTLITRTSEAGTQTMAGEVKPNQDTVGRVQDFTNPEFLAAKAEELNSADPFAATPWTPEWILQVLEILGIIN